MSGGFVTRWPVRQERPVVAGDLGPDGLIRDDVLAGWVDAACAEYLDRCAALRAARERAGLRLRLRGPGRLRSAPLGRPASVVVTAAATEVRPGSFTLAVRLRPLGEEGDRTLDVACEVLLEDMVTGEAATLGDEVRDELVAIERAARHYN